MGQSVWNKVCGNKVCGKSTHPATAAADLWMDGRPHNFISSGPLPYPSPLPLPSSPQAALRCRESALLRVATLEADLGKSRARLDATAGKPALFTKVHSIASPS